jgi:tyrosinase
MSSNRSDRRRFLARAGAMGLAAGLAPNWARAADVPKHPPLVRKSIAEFVKDPQSLAALRAAVRKMRDMDVTAPFSWVFQANIHGRPLFPPYVYQQAEKSTDPGMRIFRDDLGFNADPRGDFNFNQCAHGNWWFLPWHRAYLHFFERILRWASGDPKLSLPYWNYCDPRQTELPEVFRQPKVDGQPNPLYLPDSVVFTDDSGKEHEFPVRASTFNNALTVLGPSVTTLAALQVVQFTNSKPAPSDQAFGSPRACGTTCDCHGGALETRPHDKVHVAIGGPTVRVAGGFRVGLMGDVPTAARDPIFWLHHANIDRLWASWWALGKGRTHPDEAEWLDYPFYLYDVGPDNKPKLVTITTRDLLKTEALGYVYDQLERPAEAIAVKSSPPAPIVGMFLPLAGTARAMPPSDDGGHKMAPRGTELKTVASTSVSLPLVPRLTPAKFRSGLAPTKGEEIELVLSVEGISVHQVPGVFYDVYLEGPKDDKAPPREGQYLGSLTFFGMGHHGDHRRPRTVRFTLSPEARAFMAKVDPEELKVSFVPQSGLVAKKGAKVLLPEERTTVSIGQVRLLLAR